MSLAQVFWEALESLSANKVRSALTILGIVIGVAAVVAMLAIGQGAQDSITGSINNIGTNVLFVFPGNQETEVRHSRPLTVKDASALNDPLAAPSVQAIAPVVNAQAQVAGGGEKRGVSISGVVPAHQQVRNETLMEGEFINDTHLNGRASVAVIGPDTARALFGRETGLLGETVRINGQPFRIVGVLASKGGGSMGNQDDRILIPLTTAQSRLVPERNGNVDTIFIQAVSADAVNQASEEIAQILRTRHRTKIGEDDFTIFSQQDFLSMATTITGVLTIFLGGIAGISLLVGGIGIMNIMLVSVTERTREIGLRKALGARRRDILVQFLAESSLLSLLGGFLGILLGWMLSLLVGRIASASETPLNPAVGMNAILLSTLFSTAVGLFFGIYPANRAAGLEPVEALRYE